MHLIFSIINIGITALCFFCYSKYLNYCGFYLLTPALNNQNANTKNKLNLLKIANPFFFDKRIFFCYPFFELFCTAILLSNIYYNNYKPYTLIFNFYIISILCITIRTDLEQLLISRITTLFCIPIVFICAKFKIFQLSLFNSILGAITGYLFLFVIKYGFLKIKKQDGLGQGDLELLAFIGSFLGAQNIIFVIIIGSILAIFYCLIYTIIKKRNLKFIPLGAFLSCAAILELIFKINRIN